VARRVLNEARDQFRSGELEQAKLACADLLDRGWEGREIYTLLADIYRYEGQPKMAEDLLRRAAEALPLPAGLGEAAWQEGSHHVWVAPPPPVFWLVVIGGLAVALTAAVYVHWAPPVADWFGANPLQLVLIFVAGFLASSALSASGLIRTFDQELSELGPGENVPLWLYLLVAGVGSAWMGVAIYLWACYVRGDYSLTMGLMLASLALLGLVIGVGLGGGVLFWWLGLNLLWEGALLGWASGSIASPREWWQA
jgi:hypothetical protein